MSSSETQDEELREFLLWWLCVYGNERVDYKARGGVGTVVDPYQVQWRAAFDKHYLFDGRITVRGHEFIRQGQTEAIPDSASGDIR